MDAGVGETVQVRRAGKLLVAGTLVADFADYLRAQEEADERYQDRAAWAKSSIVNTAKSGRFSSDRTIQEYARDIWRAPCRGLGKNGNSR